MEVPGTGGTPGTAVAVIVTNGVAAMPADGGHGSITRLFASKVTPPKPYTNSQVSSVALAYLLVQSHDFRRKTVVVSSCRELGGLYDFMVNVPAVFVLV